MYILIIIYIFAQEITKYMKKLNCEIGQVFGYWTVIDNTPIIKSGHTYIKAVCKCGKEQEICLSDLIRGRATGCKSCKARKRSRQINVGDKYKHWTVIEGPKTNNYNCIIWKCQCDCGNTRWIQGNELSNPNKCFECQQCASIRRIKKQTLSNGRVGDLTLTRYTKLKKSAKNRGISFEVSIEFLWNLFISQKQICAITGDYMKSIKKASLDRIDSNKNYTEDNVQLVTYQANVSKHIMSMDSLYEFCKKVLNHANQQPSTPLTKCEGSETNS